MSHQTPEPARYACWDYRYRESTCDRFFVTLNSSRRPAHATLLSWANLDDACSGRAALPVILAGNDVRVQAVTGSGKTAAFWHLDFCIEFDVTSVPDTGVSALVRRGSWRIRVAGELRRPARFRQIPKILTLCGGNPGAQRDSLQHARISLSRIAGALADHAKRKPHCRDARTFW